RPLWSKSVCHVADRADRWSGLKRVIADMAYDSDACVGGCCNEALCLFVRIARAVAPRSVTMPAQCDAIASAGKSNAPSPGWATTAACLCAMNITCFSIKPSSISLAYLSPCDTYETTCSLLSPEAADSAHHIGTSNCQSQ